MLANKIIYITNFQSSTVNFISNSNSAIPNTLFELMRTNVLIVDSKIYHNKDIEKEISNLSSGNKKRQTVCTLIISRLRILSIYKKRHPDYSGCLSRTKHKNPLTLQIPTAGSCPIIFGGVAGNRTPVRRKSPHSIYSLGRFVNPNPPNLPRANKGWQ